MDRNNQKISLVNVFVLALVGAVSVWLARTINSSSGLAAAAFILTALNGLVAWYSPDRRMTPTQIADIYADLAVRAATGPEVIG